MKKGGWTITCKILRSGKEASILYGSYKVGKAVLQTQQYGQSEGRSVPLQKWIWKIDDVARFNLHSVEGTAVSVEDVCKQAVAEVNRQVGISNNSGTS